jgi:hypothetical protein
MNRKRLPKDPSPGSPPRSEEVERPPTPREVLEELFQLLEDYAPMWYTEEHHNRAVAALRGSIPSSGTGSPQGGTRI